MVNRLSIGQKLLIMLVAPVLGLVFFAVNGILEKSAVVAEMELLDELAGLAVRASTLTHELQKERGMTAGFIGSQGAKFASELLAQRGETDKALMEFTKQAANESFHALGAEFLRQRDLALEDLRKLQSVRDRASSLQSRASEAIAAYTHTNTILIQLVGQIANNMSDSEAARRIIAYESFLMVKERVGIERALLNSAFAFGRFPSLEQFRAFVSIVAAQGAIKEIFDGHATEAQVSLLRSRYTGDAAAELLKYRDQGFESNGTGKLTADAETWFRTATNFIDGLRDVEDRIGVDLVAYAASRRAEAQQALYFFAIIAVVAIVLAVVLAQILGRSVSLPLTKAAESAREIAHQIVSTTKQQSASANETATAVSQTTTTVDEIRQTSHVASDRSKAVTETARRSVAGATQAMQAISQGVDAMQRIRAEVEGIARNILDLSEKNIQIGEIVQSVNAIAEQSNLLAVNASIEAAKAGEHGKGFSVVAGEVKALAGQSKEATGQIRAILGEIQKSSNAAVMVTEQGTKRVEEGVSLIEELGQAVQELSRVIEESMDAATQIAATANQQLAGIEQITGAMQNIEQATRDNAAGINQLEQAAQQVQSVSVKLGELVTGKAAA